MYAKSSHYWNVETPQLSVSSTSHLCIAPHNTIQQTVFSKGMIVFCCYTSFMKSIE
jgi:hypothetical protein